MKITVCIKQVPGTAQVEIDPATGVLKRDGVESKMNPYDLYALETALRFKQSHGAEITAVTMGPPQAESVIREAFMMGVDHGAIFSDRRFGGSDVLATAYTLAQGIRAAGGADLVICGKQTTDGDTAQVGAELAEFLGIPHVAGVSRIHELSGEEILLDLDLPLHVETVRVKLPCLVCGRPFGPDLHARRYGGPGAGTLRALRLPDPGKTDFSAGKYEYARKLGGLRR